MVINGTFNIVQANVLVLIGLVYWMKKIYVKKLSNVLNGSGFTTKIAIKHKHDHIFLTWKKEKCLINASKIT